MKPIFTTLCSLFLLISMPLSGADETAAPADAATATENSAAAPLAPGQHLQQQHQYDLATSQNGDTEVIWLDGGESEQLALLERAATAAPHGSIIIFPDRGTHADWPGLIHPLRTQLTDHGWHTMTINLPYPAPAGIPERTLPTLQQRNQPAPPATDAETTAAPTTATDSTADNQTQTAPDTLTPLITQALAQLPGQGQLRIILGIGEGAVWALNYLQQQEPAPTRTVILLTAKESIAEEAPELNRLLADTREPVLDLWLSRSAVAREQARQRQRTALRNNKAGYKQIRLNQQLNDPRRVPLWLTKQVRGIIKTRILDRVSPQAPVEEPQQLTPGN